MSRLTIYNVDAEEFAEYSGTVEIKAHFQHKEEPVNILAMTLNVCDKKSANNKHAIAGSMIVENKKDFFIIDDFNIDPMSITRYEEPFDIDMYIGASLFKLYGCIMMNNILSDNDRDNQITFVARKMSEHSNCTPTGAECAN